MGERVRMVKVRSYPTVIPLSTELAVSMQGNISIVILVSPLM